ncbi:MAG: NAD-dependent malic enzyme [Fimbriimonadaceae bacterium]|nr:NAD-dependent malic enzyme [Fimbriimonadaceae bacterium]
MLTFEMQAGGEVAVDVDGLQLIETPIYNKGSAFSQEERTELGLEGLLPPHATDLEEQCQRVWEELCFKSTDEEKHIYLRGLQDRNEVLFYRLLHDHLEETMPLIYTPVVGWACRHFSHIYRRPRGIFVSYPNRDHIRRLLQNRAFRDVDVIVVTDGERILGLGDQGAGGMGIPIGKLSLYTLCGGIHPARTLPILLDCGTDNGERLDDPHYLGWRHHRIRGEQYFAFIEQFVDAVDHEFPNVLLQWEDFARDHASFLLDRYRDRLCTFNDDIQGTAAVTVAAILSAMRTTGGRLRDLRMVLLGAGSAAIGIADLVVAALAQEGVPEREALDSIWILNSRGLLTEDMADIKPFQRRFVKTRGSLSGWAPPAIGHYQLDEVVANVKPNALIGVSGQPRMFTEAIVRTVAAHADRPIIFPLSNPTSRSEATPADLIEWTDGRVIAATGSPFAPVEHGGRAIPIAQCNNSYIFPGLGLGVLASGAKRVRPSMFLAAAQEAARCAFDFGAAGMVLPPLNRIRDVSLRIALRVGLTAIEEGLAPVVPETELRNRIAERMWHPAYPRLVPAREPVGRR